MQDIILVNRQDLEEAFRKVASELARDLSPRAEEFITPEYLSTLIPYSIHWIYRESSKQRRTGKSMLPPIHRRGRKIVFLRSEVEEWITDGNVRT
ncbi:MAG: hypothetical protein R6U40_06460 [Desulfobacterales bacterium]